MHKDGRQPQTLRLTIRRYATTNKWFSRESRQCPIPNHISQRIISGKAGSILDTNYCIKYIGSLLALESQLFHKTECIIIHDMSTMSHPLLNEYTQ